MCLSDLPHRARAPRPTPELNPIRQRHRLIERHLFLVPPLVRRALRSLPPWTESDELLADGALGLIRAAQRFDPGRGVPFSRFAGRYIHGAIMDGLRARARMPAVRTMLDVAREDDGFKRIEAAADARHLLSLVSCPRRQRVLVLRYLDQASIRHVAQSLRVTTARISQLSSNALREIRRKAAA